MSVTSDRIVLEASRRVTRVEFGPPLGRWTTAVTVRREGVGTAAYWMVARGAELGRGSCGKATVASLDELVGSVPSARLPFDGAVLDEILLTSRSRTLAAVAGDALQDAPARDDLLAASLKLLPRHGVLHDALGGGEPLGFLARHGCAHGVAEAFAGPGQAAAWRRQAADRYPALAREIAASPETLARVDAGDPFEGALAGHLSALRPDLPPVRKAALRRLRDADLGPEALRVALDCAARMPAEWLPAGGPGSTGRWEALASVRSFHDACGLDADGFASRVAGGKGDWVRYAGRLRKAVAYGRNDAASKSASVVDALGRAADSLGGIVAQATCLSGEEARSAGRRLLVGGDGLVSLVGRANEAAARARAAGESATVADRWRAWLSDGAYWAVREAEAGRDGRLRAALGIREPEAAATYAP